MPSMAHAASPYIAHSPRAMLPRQAWEGPFSAYFRPHLHTDLDGWYDALYRLHVTTHQPTKSVMLSKLMVIYYV
jgi:hypothetical protein